MTIPQALRAAPLVLALWLCSALTARAEVITFDSLAQPGTSFTLVSSPYTESGFAFLGPFLSPQTGSPLYTGTGTLGIQGLFDLRAADDSPFNFTSIDVSEFGINAPFSVTFMGITQGGGSVIQNVTLNGVFGLQTFTFSGFTNLQRLIAIVGSLPIQIDNVNVSRVTQPEPIPEPATVLLLGTGLAGLGAAVRKRRRKG